MLRHLTKKERSKEADIDLGRLLAFIAGAINAGGFLVVGYYTSHMTGITSSIADLLVRNNFNLAFMSVLFLLSFICGAACSAIIINWGRSKNYSSEFALPLMFEAILFLLFGLLVGPGLHVVPPVNITITLLCFTMGLQNAMITKISNAEIRTTHVTGIATDIGIESGRFVFTLLKGKDSVAFRPAKLKAHLSLLIAFIIGGVVGAYIFQAYGMIAVIPIAVLLMVTAATPVFEDIKKNLA
jgi:uncharacterized membrane protein YoaK (UPF0700 family)